MRAAPRNNMPPEIPADRAERLDQSSSALGGRTDSVQLQPFPNLWVEPSGGIGKHGLYAFRQMGGQRQPSPTGPGLARAGAGLAIKVCSRIPSNRHTSRKTRASPGSSPMAKYSSTSPKTRPRRMRRSRFDNRADIHTQ